jgi:hypothetical protein
LAYFARFLEHADRDIARDAYLEFAHAPYEDVLAVADKFDFADFRRWLQSAAVPDERKGFYAVVLGMATRDRDRSENASLLKRLIVEDRADFRAGFDGILAGYLLLSGETGLRLIEQRLFANDQAPHGDVRHATKAVRFYYEYGPEALHGPIARATARLVERPEFAAAAITDLARWQHWHVLDRVAAMYDQKAFADGPTHRAIIGYLKACPKAEADEALERLRKLDPTGVAAAEKWLSFGK